ncbi:MAG TPA: RNA polymerase sigma factor [Bacteroidota bacterium]|nr:RNA polymerase sigma factor [Bacteroidota bacterium]
METEKRIAAQATSDEEAIAKVLAGETAAYEQIMRRYNPRLFRIVRSYLTDEDEIEDVIQEAYIKAYEALPRFEKRSSFSTWVIRIAINEALARVKQRKRLSPIGDTASDDTGYVIEAIGPLQNNETPIETLMNSELKYILEEAVDRLPENYRSVFVMREIEGMSIAETSESLDITQTNVKVRLNRAKEMLRDFISGFYHDAEVFHFDLVRCDRIVHNVLRRISERKGEAS